MEADDTLTHQRMLDDLVAAHVTTLPEEYFTIMQFADRIGRGRGAAVRILTIKVALGELETKMVLIDGHHKRVFWFDTTKGK